MEVRLPNTPGRINSVGAVQHISDMRAQHTAVVVCDRSDYAGLPHWQGPKIIVANTLYAKRLVVGQNAWRGSYGLLDKCAAAPARSVEADVLLLRVFAVIG